MIELTCTKCGVIKPIAGFSIKTSSSTGRRSQCKACIGVRELLKSAGITETLLEKAASLAESIAHEADAKIDDARLQILSDESSFVSFLVMLKSPAPLALLSMQLVDRMIQEIRDFPADRVSVGYSLASRRYIPKHDH